MAFHGERGGFRGGRGGTRGGRGTGSFRGRGSARGDPGASRGRGGRGAGGFSRGRGRGKPVFDSARLAQQKENEDAQSESESNSESDAQLDDGAVSSDDEEEEEEAAVARPFTTLLQSLVGDMHPAKRRKIENTVATLAGDSDDDLEVGKDVDEVDEDEEDLDTAIEGVFEGEEPEEQIDMSDPFETHFADPDDNLLRRRLRSIQVKAWSTEKINVNKNSNLTMSLPQSKTDRVPMPSTISRPAHLKLKQKLTDIMEKQRPEFNALEKHIVPIIFGYQDLLYCQRTTSEAISLRRLACLHAVNHVFKTRDRVIKNNAKLAKEDSSHELELRDQGFTRPKVLFLLPTRDSCVRMINMITSLVEPEQQENRKRFEESYLEAEDKFSDDKTEDFRELFGGNDDDMFRLGLKFTRKTIKYFSQFYNSDIIFASPLGMKMAIGSEEDKKMDSDFLSSIEIVIVDQADALLMQNWEHVEFIYEHLNLQPKEAHDCDFSRVRSWYLDNNATYFRQTIALSGFNTPELNTLFFNHSKNWAGKAKIQPSYPGVLQELPLKVKQTFSRLESPSITTDPDARFNYFASAIVPALTKHSKDIAGTLIFISSYLDFVRVRNYFVNSAETNSLSFGSISEYTSVRDVVRARSHFYTGRHHVLLYTERAHHFRRYPLRGVRKVIMYSLPDNPLFYKEIVGGYLERTVSEGKLESGEGRVRVIFSKWDLLKLERVGGTERVGKMIRDKGDTFDFV